MFKSFSDILSGFLIYISFTQTIKQENRINRSQKLSTGIGDLHCYKVSLSQKLMLQFSFIDNPIAAKLVALQQNLSTELTKKGKLGTSCVDHNICINNNNFTTRFLDVKNLFPFLCRKCFTSLGVCYLKSFLKCGCIHSRNSWSVNNYFAFFAAAKILQK